MLFDRFDHAVLSLFTFDALANPFTVVHSGEVTWTVRSGLKTIGVVTLKDQFYHVKKW